MATLEPKKMNKRRRKRIISIIVMTILELLLSIYLSYVLNQFLLSAGEILNMAAKNQLNTSRYLDFNLINSIKSFIGYQSTAQLVWFGLFQFIYICFLVMVVFKNQAKLQDTTVMKITEDISIPIPVGNGQYGTARFMNEHEKEDIFTTFCYSGTNILLEGKGGLVVQMTLSHGKEKILYISQAINTLIVGATGSGKTRRILYETIWLQLLSGISVIASDVKGEIYAFTSKFADSLGYRTIALDFRNPEKGARYNFLQQILDASAQGDMAKAISYTWDLVSVLVGEAKGEKLWNNGESAAIASAILIVCLEAPKEFRNLTNVYYFLAYMCEVDENEQMPINDYLAALSDTHPAKGVFAVARLAPDRTRGSFFTSALATLRLFTDLNVASMTSDSDFRLGSIGREKTILYMIIPDEKKTLYPLASMFTQMSYIELLEVANQNGLVLPISTDYDLDELGNFPTIPILPNLVSAGRSRGIRANGIIQADQQLVKNYKDDYKTIRANFKCKIFLSSDDPETKKAFSETLGKYTVQINSVSTSSSDKDRNNNYSNSSNMAGRELLMPDEIGRIKYPYALVASTGEYPLITTLPDLSYYRLNEIYGLGDENFNRQLIIEREDARPKRKIETLNLWGIWKSYQYAEETVSTDFSEQQGKERISFLD